jgi:hypothetical protein
MLYLLTEAGDFLLQETGDRIILEQLAESTYNEDAAGTLTLSGSLTTEKTDPNTNVLVTSALVYLETEPPDEALVTAVLVYVEIGPETNLFTTQAGAYSEIGDEAVAQTQAGAYSELGGTTVMQTQAGAYAELGQDSVKITKAGAYAELAQNTLQATQVGVYAETLPNELHVTQAGVYAEIWPNELHVTQVGVYAEIFPNELHATQAGAYAEIQETHKLEATQAGAYAEIEETEKLSATQAGAYAEIEISEILSVTQAGAYAEIEEDESLVRVVVTQAGAYAELDGEDPATTLGVTQAGAYAEVEETHNLSVTQAGAYAEIEETHKLSVTQASAYLEIEQTYVRATHLGVYAEIEAGELPPSILATAVGAVAEMVPPASSASTTQFAALVEIQGQWERTSAFNTLVEINGQWERVTQFGVLVELKPRGDMATFHPRTAGARALHTRLPDEVTGYAFDPEHSWWEVIVPEETENLVVNPSFEAALGSEWLDDIFDFQTSSDSTWAAVTRVTNGLYGATHGGYAMKLDVSPGTTGLFIYHDISDDHYYQPGYYTFSINLACTQIGSTFKLQVRNQDNDTIRAQNTFTVHQTGWHRYWITYANPTTEVNYLCLVSPASNTAAGTSFYTDAWQFENKAYPTTYCDGDMTGWDDLYPNQSYAWRGAAHASKSIRRATTGNGGRPISLSEEIQFYTTGITGLGMSPVEPQTTDLASGRQVHRGVRSMPSEFTITGRIYAETYRELARKRDELIRLLRPNNTTGRNRILLRYQATNERGKPIGQPLDIACVYRDGLRGSITNFYQEGIALQFQASQPFPEETIENYKALQGLTQARRNGILYQSRDGVVSQMGTGDSDAIIDDAAFDVDGRVIAVGNFTTICGSSVTRVGRFNLDSGIWSQVGISNFTHRVRVIDSGGQGAYPMVVGGDFTGYGDTVCNYIAMHDSNVDTWTALFGGGVNGAVYEIQRDLSTGYIHVGGDFTKTDPTGTNIDMYGAAYYKPDTNLWGPMGGGAVTGVIGRVNTILIGYDGYIYYGGNFTQKRVSGVGVDLDSYHVARVNRSTNQLESMGAGFNGQVYKLFRGPDSFIYALGAFTRDKDDTYDLRHFAKWNGEYWEEVINMGISANTRGHAEVDTQGKIWICTSTSITDPRLGPLSVFGWQGGVFYPPPWKMYDIGFTGIGAAQPVCLKVKHSQTGERLFVTGDINDDNFHAIPYVTTVNYEGGADGVMRIVIKGGTAPRLIANLDTGGEIHFNSGFALGENEKLTIDFYHDTFRMYTEQRHNLTKEIVVGPSNLAAFKLQPGRNRIAVLVPGEEQVGSEVYMLWRNRHWGIDPAVNM